MTRLTAGARITKCMAAVMSAFLFITPLSWAQAAVPENAAAPAKTEAAADKGTLTFANPSGQTATAAIPLPETPVAARAESATAPIPETQSDSSKSDTGKSAEITGAEASSEDGTALAQAAGGSKRIDPIYKKLPQTSGEIKLRHSFKLFAKEELIHNLSFRETPIKEVIAELANRGNLNILIDKSVFGKITGDLHDVTLNEAMDAVLAASALESRVLDSNTCIIGSVGAMGLLGLNRTHTKVFKLNYISAFEAANDLTCSVFFRGFIPEFGSNFKNRLTQSNSEHPTSATESREESASAGMGEGGAQRKKEQRESSGNTQDSKEDGESGADYSFGSHLDSGRSLKGSSKLNMQEGTGFNSAGQDPGTLQIRAYQEITTDYAVDNNGGGAIVIPDARNRQLIVVGTPDDLTIAEECIRLLDRRPRLVHVQVSLVELNNQGIRQLGAALNLQGQGASGALLGGSGAPMINFLPGLGGSGMVNSLSSVITSATSASALMGLGGKTGMGQFLANNYLPTGSPNPLLGTFSTTQSISTPSNATVGQPNSTYNGILGGWFSAPVTPTQAGVTASSNSMSNLNFMALSQAAGGKTNIATMPLGLNLSLNLLLQQNKAKVLANPSVVVSDNTEALVTLATEVIHKVTTTVSLGVTNVNVELTKAGIFLDVMPKCSDDGFIYMRIRPQVSAPSGPQQTFANQQIIVTLLSIREIMAQEIRVKDGQTLVLGGLFSEQESSQIAKVPYLAETPIFGALFRNTLKGRQRTELMLMITPKIVEDDPPVSGQNAPPATL